MPLGVIFEVSAARTEKSWIVCNTDIMKDGYDVHMATLGRVKYSQCLKFVLHIRYTHITHITQILHSLKEEWKQNE